MTGAGPLFADKYSSTDGINITLSGGYLPPCKTITYRKIVAEFNYYLAEIDRLIRECVWVSQQRETPYFVMRLANLRCEREHCEKQVIKIHQQLEHAGVDLTRIFMGSSTGFCEAQGRIYPECSQGLNKPL